MQAFYYADGDQQSVMDEAEGKKVIATILRHDDKTTSYKIALIRAINDLVLAFPDVAGTEAPVAVPLRMLAEQWIAYYWPFAALETPIFQGPRTQREGTLRNDMSFRPALTALRLAWEQAYGLKASAADGFFLVAEMHTQRGRENSPPSLLKAFHQAVKDAAKAVQQPIRYAGPEQWTVFQPPILLNTVAKTVVALPGAQPHDSCLLIKASLWNSFRELSLWIEALCIHEWCLFTENVRQDHPAGGARGAVYTMLTERPENRRPLTWERNGVDLLLWEGVRFVCPWTHRTLDQAGSYDLDHLLPLAVYPVNELWNLLPVDPKFNRFEKRDRLPSAERLRAAIPYFAQAYANYEQQPDLKTVLHADAGMRFAGLGLPSDFSGTLATRAAQFMESVAGSRNVKRF